MADNKSCEGKLTTLECMECGYREVFTERQFKFVDGYSCDVCNGPVMPTITKPGEKIKNRKTKKHNININSKKHTAGYLTVKVDIDVSDALKGLKAVERQAKKTARALKEVEGYCSIESLSDDDILQELAKRSWDIDETKLSAQDGTIPCKSFIKMQKNYNNKQGGHEK